MPIPRVCPNRSCSNHNCPPKVWRHRFGFYRSIAHGHVQRYRCRRCGRTVSDQTESLQYYAKRQLPLRAIWLSLLGSCSMREIARRYRVSCPTIQRSILRLGRQAMAAHVLLLRRIAPCDEVVIDGLRSSVGAQDYPCDITTVVESHSQTILSMCHTIFRRGGAMTGPQRKRMGAKFRVWSPPAGSMKSDISLLVNELWNYLRPSVSKPAVVRSDKSPVYRAALKRDPPTRHFYAAQMFDHQQTASTEPRTRANPLFPVNYVDRLLRHRLKEHTRETIAVGRNASMQMHRAWIFAYDHNCRREYRVRRPMLGTHVEQGLVGPAFVSMLERRFFRYRIKLEGLPVAETLQRVWRCGLATPPLRWHAGQTGTSVVVPGYALADLG